MALGCNVAMAKQWSFTVNSNSGRLAAAQGTTSSYSSSWTSNDYEDFPTLTLLAGDNKNNMNAHSDKSIQIHSGSGTCVYTLTVPEGYNIVSYTFDHTDMGSTHDKKITVNGTENLVGTSATNLAVDNIYAQSTTFTLTGANQAVKLSNFTVVVTNDLLPVAGKYYRFGYDFGGDAGVKYIQSSNSPVKGLKMTADKDENSIFYVEQDGNNLRLKSVATGKYLKEQDNTRGLHEKSGAGAITFTRGNNGCIKIQAPSYLHANSSGTNYFVDHCGGDGCSQHNFIYEEVSVVTLTIEGSTKVGATATYNGSTKALPASWTLMDNPVISEPTLIINYPGSYTFLGLFEGETSLGNTIEIASLTANRTITAKFTPSFFSATYGEKWVSLANCNNSQQVATIAEYNDTFKGRTAALDYADESQLWCLVGDQNSFKLYNRAVGETMQLNVPLTGSNTSSAQGDLAVFASTEATWKLKEQDFGYALVPTTFTNSSEMGINMWGGNNGELKLYGTAVGNKGSYWQIQQIDLTKPLTYSVKVESYKDNKFGIGDLRWTINGVTVTSTIEGDVAPKTIYLPVDATYSCTANVYRGYSFSVIGGEYNNAQLPEGGANLVATYAANDEYYLYYTPTNGHPYRIPAIATAANGHIFAISDYRPCGNDIGYGEVDIKCRISTDNGLTWGEEFFVADGQGGDSNAMTTGYGDAAIVADYDQNKLLVMMVCGKTVCHNGRWDLTKVGDPNATAVNRVARVYATFNNETQSWDWTEPVEVTDHIYSLFLNGETPTVTSMFIGSGKICQSRIVKKNEYYRLYCSMWTRDGGNRVIYSDDFGMTWNVLGTINDRPASGGDEPKVEELPDGRVLLSSRKGGGRYFNIFTFADETYTSGTWGTVVASNSVANGLSFGGNSTNGEIYIIDALNDAGEQKKVMLQSIPTGSGRTDVAVYYKEIEGDGSAYTPTTISQGWIKGIHVSTKSSCYSTMIMQADGRIGFLFEEAPGEYCIVYIPMTVETITGGAYTGVRAANIEEAQNILHLKGVGYPKEDAAKRVELANAINLTNSNLPDLIAAYKVSTEEIQMPEDGKAYNFRSVHPDGKQYLLKYNGSTLATDANATGELDAEKYICRVINEAERKYAFVNAETGKYVIFYGSSNTHPFAADNGVANGFASSYNVLGKSECDWILTPRADLCMGTMSLSTKRNRDGEANFYGAVTYTINNNGGLNANSNTNNVLYNDSHSSLFMIDEVDYENTANFWAITDQVEGADYGQSVSVFSAPFATVIPEGFKAYYAEDVYFEEGSYVVRMVLVNGQALQANQGVVLLGEEGETSALMIPATTEEFEEISDINKFVPVTEEAQVVQAGNYFFGNGNFNLLEADTEFSKNTAYLHYKADEKPAEFFTIFQSLPTSGIESVTIATDNESAIYDLQGRRVVTPVNGNLYIQNGRKFIQ